MRVQVKIVQDLYVNSTRVIIMKAISMYSIYSISIEFETEAHFPLNRMQDPKKYAIQSACMKLYSGWSNIEKLLR